MRSKLLIFAWLVLVCCPAAALDWPEQVEIGSLLVLDGPEGVACAWGISGTDIDGDAYDPVWREFQGAVAVETRYGGLLTVELKTSAKRGLAEIKWCIAVGDDGPGPDPPPPVPGKITEMWVVVVEDGISRTADQFQAMNHEPTIDWMEANGHRYKPIDTNFRDETGQIPPDDKPWIELTHGKTLPILFLARRDGVQVYDGPLPESGKEWLALLKTYGAEK